MKLFSASWDSSPTRKSGYSTKAISNLPNGSLFICDKYDIPYMECLSLNLQKTIDIKPVEFLIGFADDNSIVPEYPDVKKDHAVTLDNLERKGLSRLQRNSVLYKELIKGSDLK